MFFIKRELQAHFRNIGAWATAFALFAASSFIIGWPLRDELTTTASVGPSATLALLVLSQFLIFSGMWRQDLDAGVVDILSAQQPQKLRAYVRGRMIGGIAVGLIYAMVAWAAGTVLYSISGNDIATNLIKLILMSPALTSMAILTAATTTASTKNSTALGIVLMIPLIAPIVIFSGIYDAQSALAASTWVNSLSALVGLSAMYLMAAYLSLPSILRFQA